MRSGRGKLAIFLLAAVISIAAAASQAPSPPPPAPGEPGFAEFVASRSAAYLRMREDEILKRRQEFARADLQRHYDVIRAAVTRNLRQSDGPTWDPAITPELKHWHRVETVTGLLLNSGYRAEQFVHPAGARTLVRAMDAIFGAETDALVLAAPIVLIAEKVRIERMADNRGYLVYRVSEPIKAAPPVGTEFRVEINGLWPDARAKAGQQPSPPPPPNPSILEFATHERAVFFMAPGGLIQPVPRPGRNVSVFGPMPITGERVLPGYHSGTMPTSSTLR